jgi:hypothetical protein
LTPEADIPETAANGKTQAREDGAEAHVPETPEAGGNEPVLPEPVPPAAAPSPPPPAPSAAAPTLPEPSPPPPAPGSPPPAAPAPPRQPAVPPPAVPDFIRPAESKPPRETEEPPESAIPDMPYAGPERMGLVPQSGEDIVYSRSVKAYTGQYIEIPFRGPGWVYLGELGSRRGVFFDNRQIDSEGMVFVFRADETGTFSLKFNRQDFIRDVIITDYVQVIVGEAPSITGTAWSSAHNAPERVYAGPRWPPADGAPPAADAGRPQNASDTAGALPPAAAETNGPPALSGSAAAAPAAAGDEAAAAAALPSPNGEPQSGASVPEEAARAEYPAAPESPPDLLALAKTEYDAGRIASALNALGRYHSANPFGNDELYWLYGQTLEANGPTRDIKTALEYYRRLVDEYPQSARYDEARRRVAYLERFYFNIR